MYVTFQVVSENSSGGGDGEDSQDFHAKERERK